MKCSSCFATKPRDVMQLLTFLITENVATKRTAHIKHELKPSIVRRLHKRRQQKYQLTQSCTDFKVHPLFSELQVHFKKEKIGGGKIDNCRDASYHFKAIRKYSSN